MTTREKLAALVHYADHHGHEALGVAAQEVNMCDDADDFADILAEAYKIKLDLWLPAWFTKGNQ